MKQMSLEEQMEEIFSYYGEQKDRHTQEMVVALLRELQEVQGHITPALKKTSFGDNRSGGRIFGNDSEAPSQHQTIC